MRRPVDRPAAPLRWKASAWAWASRRNSRARASRFSGPPEGKTGREPRVSRWVAGGGGGTGGTLMTPPPCLRNGPDPKSHVLLEVQSWDMALGSLSRAYGSSSNMSRDWPRFQPKWLVPQVAPLPSRVEDQMANVCGPGGRFFTKHTWLTGR